MTGCEICGRLGGTLRTYRMRTIKLNSKVRDDGKKTITLCDKCVSTIGVVQSLGADFDRAVSLLSRAASSIGQEVSRMRDEIQNKKETK